MFYKNHNNKTFFINNIMIRKYFILLRLQYSDIDSYITLHKGIVLSKNNLNEYLNFCLSIISLK